MDMYGYSGVFLVKRFLDKDVPEVTNMSDINKANPHGCDYGALTDRFGVLIQGLLAIVAFSTLMCESVKSILICVKKHVNIPVLLCLIKQRQDIIQSDKTRF